MVLSVKTVCPLLTKLAGGTEMVLRWIPMVFWPPFVLLYVVGTIGFLAAGLPGQIIAGLLWFLFILNADWRRYEPVFDWYERNVTERFL